MAEYEGPNGEMRTTNRALGITNEYYCDAGAHAGQYHVTISGYVTAEQLEELRKMVG